MAVEVSLEFTPNPNTLKFVVNQSLLEKGAANYTSRQSAENSPLAQKLFDVAGVAGVMIGHNFVTVTKGDQGDWEEIHNAARDTISNFVVTGAKAVNGESAAPVNHANAQVKEVVSI